MAIRFFVNLRLASTTLLAAVAACAGTQALVLEPDDTRAIYSIEVEDEMESALLEQEVELNRFRQEGSRLYFFETPGLIERLSSIGYEPIRQNPYEIYRRVVRVEARGSEQELSAAGIRVINREDGYWVAEASIASLRSLQSGGYRLRAVGPDEPRPREVRIDVSTREAIEAIGELQIDIYNVEATETGFRVFGGAFDYQIDRLREEGFNVERFSTVDPENRP